VNTRLLQTVALVWLASSVTYLQLTDFPFTPDSYAYVAAAMSLEDHGRLTVPFAPSRAIALPVPYTAWPPGYPIAIALVHALGPDHWTAARLVSMLGVLIAAAVFARLVRSLPGGELAFALLLISWPTALCATRAWSEGPFAALLCCCLWAAYSFRAASRPHIGHLVLAFVCAGLAGLFRYSGVFLLAPLLYLAQREGLRMHRIAASLGALLAAVPLALWVWRNAELGASWRGATPHPPFWWRAPAEFCRALGELSFAPVGLPAWIQASVGLILIVFFLYLVRLHLPRLRDSALAATSWPFLAAFVVGIVLARGVGLTGVLVPRLIWPVLPLGAAVALALVHGERTFRRKAAYLVMPVLLAVQSVSVLLAPRVYPSLEQRLVKRAVPAFLKAESALLANRGWEIWRQTGRPVYYVPFHPHEDRLLGTDTLAAWARMRGVQYLAWFEEGAAPRSQRGVYGDLYDAVRTGDTLSIEPVWRADSVAVYRIRTER